MSRRGRTLVRAAFVVMVLLTGEAAARQSTEAGQVRSTSRATVARPDLLRVERSATSPTTATTATTTATPMPTTTTTTAPPPAPALATPEPPANPPSDLIGRAGEALSSTVPAAWLTAVSPRLVLIEGATSWSSTDGTISVSRYHASGPWTRLQAIMAHEWGHQAAFRYGTRAYLGAPPAGWPYDGPQPQEMWGHCVALALTGVVLHQQCPPTSLDWTREWLGAGPP